MPTGLVIKVSLQFDVYNIAMTIATTNNATIAPRLSLDVRSSPLSASETGSGFLATKAVGVALLLLERSSDRKENIRGTAVCLTEPPLGESSFSSYGTKVAVNVRASRAAARSLS